MTKVRITRIGIITEDGAVMDWTFDGYGLSPRQAAIDLSTNLIGGYTINELREICRLSRELENLTKGDLPAVSTPVCPECSYSLRFREKRAYGRHEEVWVCPNCLHTWILEEQPPSHKNQEIGPVRQLLNKIWGRIL